MHVWLIGFLCSAALTSVAIGAPPKGAKPPGQKYMKEPVAAEPTGLTRLSTHAPSRLTTRATSRRTSASTVAPECVGDICTYHTKRGDSGKFQSDGWPSQNYKPNEKKRWILLTNDGEEYQLNFGTPFDVEGSSSGSCYDSVLIIDGAKHGSVAPCTASGSAVLHKYCGSTPPPSITVITNKLYVDFCTDSSIEKKGFQLQWQDIAAPPTTTRKPTSPHTPIIPGDCGKQSDKYPPSEGRIVGGVHANPHSWPWTAALFKDYFGGSYQFCGATLISSRWMITAGHCFEGEDESEVHVKLGADNKGPGYEPNEDSQQVVEIEKAFVHPEFSMSSISHDITLLKLKTDVTINDYVRPICVGEITDEGLMTDQTPVTVAGWGSTHEGGSTIDLLMQVTVPVVDTDHCNDEYSGRIDETMMCAGLEEGGKDSCQGDSGGPLMYKRPSDGRWYLEGIVSWGRGCAEAHYAGVYSRVSALREWIDETIENNS